jgi:hypothetical protein
MKPDAVKRGQEKAGLIQKHRVDAHDEIASVVIAAGEMPANSIARVYKIRDCHAERSEASLQFAITRQTKTTAETLRFAQGDSERVQGESEGAQGDSERARGDSKGAQGDIGIPGFSQIPGTHS